MLDKLASKHDFLGRFPHSSNANIHLLLHLKNFSPQVLIISCGLNFLQHAKTVNFSLINSTSTAVILRLLAPILYSG